MDCVKITPQSINEFKKQYRQLSHIRTNKDTFGYFYSIDGKLQAMVNTEDKDGEIWIQGIELFGDSKGKGLSKYLLDLAVMDLGATHLSVNKKNSIAKHLYDKYGFEVYDEDDTMYYMRVS
jgi:ribosomal protein S18 acetylase RimI-like enzyme